MIIQVENNKEKEMISRTILEALPDWFGLPEAREEYIVNLSLIHISLQRKSGIPVVMKAMYTSRHGRSMTRQKLLRIPLRSQYRSMARQEA